MADLKKLAEDATEKALLAPVKEAAKRAAEDLLTSDEEKAARDREQKDAAKKRLPKLVLLCVLGLFVIAGIIGIVASYWHWFLMIGVLGLGAFYLHWRWKRGRQAKLEAGAARAATVELTEEREIGKSARAGAAAAGAEEARAQAIAAEEAAVDDELAAMKARLKR